MPTVFITGASRGIGLEFCRQYLAKGWTVLAACRDPAKASGLQELKKKNQDRLLVIKMDVSKEDEIIAAAQRAAGLVDSVDLCINNAGCFAPGEEGLEKTEMEKMDHVFRTNTIGPVLVTRHLLPLLRKGKSPKVTFLVSGAALLRKELGGKGSQYSYGSSKAALNYIIRCVAADLKPHGIIAAGVGPGYVQTDMTAGAPEKPPLVPEESVRHQIATYERLTMDKTGCFFTHDGREADIYIRDNC